MTHIQILTVYLGSSGHARPVFKESAKQLGRLIGKRGKSLVYGGMDAGLMGLVASEAIRAGAHVTGIIPMQLKDSERIHPHLSETVLVETLWERKRKMFMAADAVIALPGGFGTLDESLEILHWGERRLHDKVLVFINIEGYWDPIIEYVQTLPDFDPQFLLVANTVENAFTLLENWENRVNVKENGLPHYEDNILRDTDEPIIISNATIKNTYYVITALGLKQLGKHNRPIGILNDHGQFDKLLEWITRAAKETFLTPKCLNLFDTAKNKNDLLKKLARQSPVKIDLHKEKWGKGVTKEHLEVVKKE